MMFLDKSFAYMKASYNIKIYTLIFLIYIITSSIVLLQMILFGFSGKTLMENKAGFSKIKRQHHIFYTRKTERTVLKYSITVWHQIKILIAKICLKTIIWKLKKNHCLYCRSNT